MFKFEYLLIALISWYFGISLGSYLKSKYMDTEYGATLLESLTKLHGLNFYTMFELVREFIKSGKIIYLKCLFEYRSINHMSLLCIGDRVSIKVGNSDLLKFAKIATGGDYEK